MNFRDEYLSDEELDALIVEIEQEDLVVAPPCIKERLLYREESKKRDFAMYCLRVVASAAAAIVMLFALPGILGNMSPKIADTVVEVYESEIQKTQIPTRQEVLAGEKYASKEEVLGETSFLNKVFRSISFLEKNIDYNIFSKTDGGK